jgi:hypothetical protein
LVEQVERISLLVVEHSAARVERLLVERAGAGQITQREERPPDLLSEPRVLR